MRKCVDEGGGVCKPPGPAFNPESMLLHLEVN